MINCSPMPASDFEFRNRFLLISAVFWLGFAAYRIDHVNVVERALMWLSVPAAAWLTVKTVVFGVGAGPSSVSREFVAKSAAKLSIRSAGKQRSFASCGCWRTL